MSGATMDLIIRKKTVESGLRVVWTAVSTEIIVDIATKCV
jgi:hypothetical protein